MSEERQRYSEADLGKELQNRLYEVCISCPSSELRTDISALCFVIARLLTMSTAPEPVLSQIIYRQIPDAISEAFTRLLMHEGEQQHKN